MAIEKLENGNYYHIYNHAVGGLNLFDSPDNYEYFLSLYDKYISPIAETYAWVLMPNHFHILVRIKEDVVYKYSNSDGSIDAVRFSELKWKTTNRTASAGPVCVKNVDPSKHFSHCFNAYTKYFNKRYQTWGTLFERPFRRKRIEKERYLKNLVVYIHNNPVHHGFCSHAIEYPWSSYLSCLSDKETKLQRDAVLSWFGDKANFKFIHEKGGMDVEDFEL